MKTALSLVNQPAPVTLDDYLMAFLRYGQPSLYFAGKGWWCRVEMHVSSVGASFKVDSDMKQQTPIDAATQCWERMHQTLKDLNV